MDLLLRQSIALGRRHLQLEQLTALPGSLQLHPCAARHFIFLAHRSAIAAPAVDMAALAGSDDRIAVGAV